MVDLQIVVRRSVRATHYLHVRTAVTVVQILAEKLISSFTAMAALISGEARAVVNQMNVTIATMGFRKQTTAKIRPLMFYYFFK